MTVPMAAPMIPIDGLSTTAPTTMPALYITGASP